MRLNNKLATIIVILSLVILGCTNSKLEEYNSSHSITSSIDAKMRLSIVFHNTGKLPLTIWKNQFSLNSLSYKLFNVNTDKEITIPYLAFSETYPPEVVSIKPKRHIEEKTLPLLEIFPTLLEEMKKMPLRLVWSGDVVFLDSGHNPLRRAKVSGTAMLPHS